MHKPFQKKFSLQNGSLFAEVSVNRKTGEFFYFPKSDGFLKERRNLTLLQSSHSDIEVHALPVDHISWHKDGVLHIKYPNKTKKTVITKVEKPFSEFSRRSLLPLISHSVRGVSGQPITIISLLAGLDIIQNLALLPAPYSAFIIKEQKNEHVFCVTNTEANLEFGYIFINLPIFIPISNKEALFSFTVPLQEDDLYDVDNYLKQYKKQFTFAPIEVNRLVPSV